MKKDFRKLPTFSPVSEVDASNVGGRNESDINSKKLSSAPNLRYDIHLLESLL